MTWGMQISVMFVEKYAKHYSDFNQGKPYQDEVAWVYEWARQPRSILDIGCGHADYWKFYPGHVYLRGIERSKDMIAASGKEDMIFNIDVLKEPIPRGKKYALATALFDVLNYMPSLNWLNDLPIKRGGHLIFDIWSLWKAKKDGFKRTFRRVDKMSRVIYPIKSQGKAIDLRVMLFGPGFFETEVHKMYVHSFEDVKRQTREAYDIKQVVYTESWQTWYKLRKK